MRRLLEVYADELSYLGIDLKAWLDDSVRNPVLTAGFTEELGAALALYRPVRPQGVTLAEETERADRHAELEAAVLAIQTMWEALPRDRDPERDLDPDPDDTEYAQTKEAKVQHKPRELAEMRRAGADCFRSMQ